MQAVVLVKQVPDVRAGKVGVHPDGTIDRSSAAAITNPADLHAVEAALTVADHVVAVSMGPRTAEHALREALAIGADQAILLSDRAFAGSDTWATAHVLAAAVSRLEVDLILCGVSALDGETGQVGPQVAERLGVPQATYAEHLEVAGNELTVRRIIEGGYETVVMPLPALVTVAETGYLPRYPTLPGRQRARNAEIAVWAAADIGLGEADAGLAASPTKVAHMEAVPLAAADCRWVGEALTIEGLARALVDSGALSARVHAPMVADALRSEVTPPAGDPAVWVVCESDGGDLTRGSAELLSKAVELSPMLGGPVAAVVIGDDVGGVAATAARYGAEVVLVAEDPRLTPYRCLTHTRVLVDAIRSREPAAVLFSATTTGRDLAPRVAARIGAGLAADCTDLFVDDWDRRGEHFDALLHMVRPALSGGVLATCLAPRARPQMATVRPGVFGAVARPRQLRLISLPVSLEPDDLTFRVVDAVTQRTDVDLATADVIVAGGAGCDAASWHFVEDLAAAIGGRVAASRGAVSAALADRSIQVGQTGVMVRPRLYIACGISGALQHVVGMQGAETVVAINRDRGAPIFRHAHFGIVGEVAGVLPALTEAFRAARGE